MKLYTVLYRKKNEEWKTMKQFRDELPAITMMKSLQKDYESKVIIARKESKKSLF